MIQYIITMWKDEYFHSLAQLVTEDKSLAESFAKLLLSGLKEKESIEIKLREVKSK